jgi:hypothetical protein
MDPHLSNVNDFLHSSLMTDEGRLIIDDDFMLDTTQDLPIRKPQSAYVIFGKMVRFLMLVFIKIQKIEKRSHYETKSWH